MNKIKEIEQLHKAVEAGDPEASFLLGLCYLYGEGVSVNPKKAMQMLTLSAKNGHPEALNVIEASFNLSEEQIKAVKTIRKMHDSAKKHGLI